MTDDAATPVPDQRSRIRDAALRQFGAYGFKGASIRGIAAAAEVSPGLVQHHFSTKEKLREECDAYVLSAIRGVRTSVVGGEPGRAGSDFVAEAIPTLTRIWPYLVRAMLDGDSDVTSTWFTLTAAEYRAAFADERFGEPISEEEDLSAIIATYTAMQLGLGVFLTEVARYLDSDVNAPETLVRVAKARTFLATRQLVHDEVARSFGDSLEGYLRQIREQHQQDREQNSEHDQSEQPHQE